MKIINVVLPTLPKLRYFTNSLAPVTGGTFLAAAFSSIAYPFLPSYRPPGDEPAPFLNAVKSISPASLENPAEGYIPSNVEDRKGEADLHRPWVLPPPDVDGVAVTAWLPTTQESLVLKPFCDVLSFLYASRVEKLRRANMTAKHSPQSTLNDEKFLGERPKLLHDLLHAAYDSDCIFESPSFLCIDNSFAAHLVVFCNRFVTGAVENEDGLFKPVLCTTEGILFEGTIIHTFFGRFKWKLKHLVWLEVSSEGKITKHVDMWRGKKILRLLGVGSVARYIIASTGSLINITLGATTMLMRNFNSEAQKK